MVFSDAFAAEKVVMKLAYGRPEGTAVDKSIKWFVEKVKQDSGGRIVFELYPNFALEIIQQFKKEYLSVMLRCSFRP